MTLQEIQTQALNLSTEQKWQLVQTLLYAIQQENQTSAQNSPQISEDNAFEHLHPWTKSLVGVIQNDEDVPEEYISYENLREEYINYLTSVLLTGVLRLI